MTLSRVLAMTGPLLLMSHQAATELVLSGPFAELRAPFSGVSSLAELSDGRVVVADETEHAVWLVNFATNQRQRLGREGDGPREYRDVEYVFAIGHDSVLLDDWRNARFVVFAAGRLSGSPVAREGRVLTSTVRAIDAQGRMYMQGPTAGRDSVAIMRWSPRTRSLDTIAFAQTGVNAVHDRSNAGAFQEMSAVMRPRPLGDVWGVFPDGALIVARVRDYHVEYFSAVGRRVAGPRIPYTPIRVPAAERTGHPPNPDKFRPAVLGSYAPKPTVSRDSLFWVQRPTALETDAERYDVFDRSTRLVRHVVLPKDTRLVGFGSGTIYVAHTAEDGTEHLRRYTTTVR